MRCSGSSSSSLTPMHDRGVDLVLGRHGQDDPSRRPPRGASPAARGCGRRRWPRRRRRRPAPSTGVSAGSRSAVIDDLVAVDVHRRRPRCSTSLVEAPHHRVVAQQVGQLLVVEEVVDRHDLDVVAVAEDAKDAAADAAETVDADADCHHAASCASMLGEAPDQIDHPVGVAPAVVVPGEGLRDPVAQHHRRQRVERARVGAAHDVARDDRIVLVVHDALPVARRGRPHDLVDGDLRHRPLVPADQVDDRAVGHRDVDRHAGDPAGELGEQLHRPCGPRWSPAG